MSIILSSDDLKKLEQKQKELAKLEKLITKANFIEKLNNQAAPSSGLEVKGISYLGEISELCDLAKALKVRIDAVINEVKENSAVKEEQLTEVIKLSAELKDKKRSAFGKIAALKTNPAYEKIRRKSSNKVAEITDLIDESDSLLVELSNNFEVQPIIEQEIQIVDKARVTRNYIKAKLELAESEKTFKQDMTTLTYMANRHAYVDVLNKADYPKMAEFINKSFELLEQSRVVSPLFEQAMDNPNILMNPDTVGEVQKYYDMLTEASILKAQIDQGEIQRFSQDQSPKISELKSTFEITDQRGLYAYMGMPFQRIGRHPILMKAILESISNKDNSGPVFSEHQAMWDIFKEQTEMMRQYTAQSNESLRNFMEKQQAPVKDKASKKLPELLDVPPGLNQALSRHPKKEHSWSRVQPSDAAKKKRENRSEQSPVQASSSVKASTKPVPWKRSEPDKENIKPKDFSQTVPRASVIAPSRALLKRTEATRDLRQEYKKTSSAMNEASVKRPRRKE